MIGCKIEKIMWYIVIGYEIKQIIIYFVLVNRMPTSGGILEPSLITLPSTMK